MYNEFDHNKGFSKGFKILHEQDIGNWSNLGNLDDSDFFDFLFRRFPSTFTEVETPTPEEPNGSTLICGNSYFNNNRVTSIYYNGVDLCATPPEDIAEPETPEPSANIIGRLLLQIDTRKFSNIGSNTAIPSNKNFEVVATGRSGLIDINWGDGTSDASVRAGRIRHVYQNPGIYTVTISARSTFNLNYPDIGGYGNCILSIDYIDDVWISTLSPLDVRGCINLQSINFPSRDIFNRPYGKDQFFVLETIFEGCVNLTSIDFFDTSRVFDWSATFAGCSSLRGIPTYDYSGASQFTRTFANSGLVVWDSTAPFDKSSESFVETWFGCSNLKDFPPGKFDNIFQKLSDESARAGAFRNRLTGIFEGCALTPTSIENILVSLANTKVRGKDRLTLVPLTNVNVDLNGGTNAKKSTWTAAANDAYSTLSLRGWNISFNS